MATHLRISVKGAMPGGENWSVNPVYTISDFNMGVTGQQIQQVATAVATIAVPGGIRTAWSSGVSAHTIRVEARNANGDLDELAEAALGAGQTGSGVAAHPYQTSWCVSLLTAQVGATGRGRLYWPATGQSISTGTLRPSTANAAAFATANVQYLQSVQTQIQTVFSGARLVVWSRKSTGRYLVNTIRVGDILDTQRRRRDSVAEAYSGAAYA